MAFEATLKEKHVESTLRVPAKPLPALLPLPLAALSLALRATCLKQPRCRNGFRWS